jgi:hypothetical protein
MNCNNAKKCTEMKNENEKMRNDIMELCIKHANEHYDGHFTIMKFTTNWKVCFGTPADRDDIDVMPTGKSLPEAMVKALLKG